MAPTVPDDRNDPNEFFDEGIPLNDHEEPKDIETCPASPRSQMAAEALCLLSEVTRSVSTQTSNVLFTTNFEDVSIQVNMKPTVRSKAISCYMYQSKCQQINVACSPIKCIPENSSVVCSSNNQEKGGSKGENHDSDSDTFSDSDYSYESEKSISEEEERYQSIHFKRQSFLLNKELCLNDSKFFLGIPPHSKYIIKILSETIGSNLADVLLTLKKIKLDSSFKELGYTFGMSESNASRIFRRNIPIISRCLSALIMWPLPNKIKLHLPLPFIARYSQVQSIIDCYEIEIEKPSNPMHQCLTWSNYKKANTIKYLISATPDGLINFISSGYGGRISDVELTKDSGYLDVLPEGCTVMADRGFKGLDTLLASKKCKLVRPPSVKVGGKSNKVEVMLTKRIASLRVHIERVIGRIREFKMLKPHSCIDHNLIMYLDDINKTAAGLVNLQSPLIKQLN
ncbi:uncharacterized protein LOC124172309 [Ischnura elegans]|uniref:uncharacterized protein LOC124172309 n=1 Tax=Ischnura elegans TaxID=197161 RepID=UPI001ED8BBAE|nr:uncharacterized protein LOC124172309 [Ischnura elegans]